MVELPIQKGAGMTNEYYMTMTVADLKKELECYDDDMEIIFEIDDDFLSGFSLLKVRGWYKIQNPVQFCFHRIHRDLKGIF